MKHMATPDHSDKSAPQWASKALAAIRTYSLGVLLLGALCVLAGASWLAINRALDVWSQTLLIAGLVLIGTFALLRPEDVQRLLTGRSARYGSNALILSVAAIGIVVLLNYLSNRYYKRFDVTASQRHSLSPQSIQVLQELDADVEVIGLYPSRQGQDQFEQWIDEYAAHSPRIQYRTVDPIRQPGEADQLGWNSYGPGLLISQGEQSFTVSRADEQDITSALLKIARQEPKSIYFISGHNERSPADYDPAGYGKLGDLLAENYYTVKTLNLVLTDTVPADAALVVLAAPQTELIEQEQETLITYLLQGGKALVMIDPGPETGINEVLAPWQVSIENKVVVDVAKSLSGDPLTPVIDSLEFSQMTKDLSNLMIAMPIASPIQSSLTPGGYDDTGITYTPLAQTSSRSWAETDTESTEVQYDEGLDQPGPLTLVASVEAPASVPGEGPEGDLPAKTRLVLIGDADLVANDVLSQIPNGQFLVLNAINWLAEEESLIAIGPKTYQAPTIRLNTIQEGAVCFGTLILIPAVIVVVGVVVWLKRR